MIHYLEAMVAQTDKQKIKGLEHELLTVWTALSKSRGPIIITDCNQPDDPIIYTNQAFLDLTGYTREEVIGHNCRFLQGPKTDKKTITKLRDAVKTHKDIRVQIYNYKKNGEPFWNDLIMSPVLDDTGKATHFIGLQLDDTDRIKREEELRKSQEQLARSNQELEQFAYVASHDLQEPLRMIVSYLGLLEKRYAALLDEKAHTYIDYAVDGGRRMQELINDLLTFSRVKTRAHPFSKTDMNQVLNDVLFNLDIAIKEQDAQIESEKLPIVHADAIQMLQLLQNLIKNALTYTSKTDKKKQKINVTVTKKGKMWEFSVSDNGIGIEKQYYDRIFNIFQRLHTREEYPGTGIGLALCKRIIERHGGTIHVTSEPNKGSRFYFTLPIK